MIDLRFRNMRIEDLSEVMCIERQSFSSPWSYELFLHEIIDKTSAAIVVEAEGDVKTEMLGYLFYWRIGEEIHITNIAVARLHRRQGVGESMIRWMMDNARENGIKKLSLEVRVSNKAALEMYAKLGFTGMGVRKRYYTDNGEDAIIMTLEGLR
jgi:ribosomal-protein-alanine N-acetyltransferase